MRQRASGAFAHADEPRSSLTKRRAAGLFGTTRRLPPNAQHTLRASRRGRWRCGSGR